MTNPDSTRPAAQVNLNDREAFYAALDAYYVDPDAARRAALLEIAADIGRLRKRHTDDYDAELLRRIAARLVFVYWWLTANAATLTRDFFRICGDWDVAADEALSIVDERQRILDDRLGNHGRAA